MFTFTQRFENKCKSDEEVGLNLGGKFTDVFKVTVLVVWDLTV